LQPPVDTAALQAAASEKAASDQRAAQKKAADLRAMQAAAAQKAAQDLAAQKAAQALAAKKAADLAAAQKAAQQAAEQKRALELEQARQQALAAQLAAKPTPPAPAPAAPRAAAPSIGSASPEPAPAPTGIDRPFSARIVSGGAPNYPETYADNPRTGSVIVHCTILTSGRPADCSVVSVVGGNAFAGAALSWLRNGGPRFAPVLHNGQPVEAQAQWRIAFAAPAPAAGD
jgi:TonB family protein